MKILNGEHNAFGLWDRITQAFAASHGFSDVRQIAGLLGLSLQSVYKWQKGMLPSIETTIRISDLTNSSIHWLLTGEGPKTIKAEGQKQIASKPEIEFSEEEREAIEKVAVSSGHTYADMIHSLVMQKLRELEAWSEPVDITMPVYRAMSDEAFNTLGQIIESAPPEQQPALVRQLIGELVMRAAGQK